MVYTARKQVCKSMRVQYGGITDTKQILLRKLAKCQYNFRDTGIDREGGFYLVCENLMG
jgi:hypothetical protein